MPCLTFRPQVNVPLQKLRIRASRQQHLVAEPRAAHELVLLLLLEPLAGAAVPPPAGPSQELGNLVPGGRVPEADGPVLGGHGKERRLRLVGLRGGLRRHHWLPAEAVNGGVGAAEAVEDGAGA